MPPPTSQALAVPPDSTAQLAPPPAWRESTIHSAYVRIAFDLADKLGIQTGARALTQARMLPFMDILPLLDALDARRNPYLGAALGEQVPAAAHGAMGYAVVSSATVGQAMETAARYSSMRNRLFSYQCSVSTKETVLTVTPSFEMGDYRTFTEIGTTLSICRMIQSVASTEAAAKMQLDAHWPKGPELPGSIETRHSRPQSMLRVPADVARAPTLTSDAKLYAIACRSCEEELAILDGNLAARLRAIMPNEHNQWPSLVDAAQRFAMSPRTLIRRLAAEGFSYQSLLDEAKGEMACWYLRNTTLPLSGIAEQLGFMSDSNFSRSFRRWRGVAPLAYRRASQQTAH